MKHLPTALLFDWDNTIVDNQRFIADAVKKTLNEMGASHIPYEPYSGPRLEYFKNIFGDDCYKADTLLKKNLYATPLEGVLLFDGIIDVLDFLKQNNVYTAIVSNKLSQFLHNEIKHFKMEKWFDKIVGSGDTPFDKPSPEPLFFALKDAKIEINKKNIAFVGDSIVDMQSAENANVNGIIYSKYIKEYPNNIRVNNFNELLILFRETLYSKPS